MTRLHRPRCGLFYAPAFLSLNMKAAKLLLLPLLLLHLSMAKAQVTVAAAANLQAVMPHFCADFEKQTGIKITVISGSSGKLAAQISNGAPFDIFLSADMAFAQAMYDKRLATAAPVVYAKGKLIICSTRKADLKSWRNLLKTSKIDKIAIANPAVAPYGIAAMSVLQKSGLSKSLQGKIVYGESISQVNTYIITGVTDVGFTTAALLHDPQLKKKLYWQLIDNTFYAPIEQGMVLLKRGSNNASAVKFYNYLLSSAAKSIFSKNGYQ